MSFNLHLLACSLVLIPAMAKGSQGGDEEAGEVVREATRAIRAKYWDISAAERMDRWPEGPAYASRAVAYDTIRGMLSLLNDPSTRFLTPDQADALVRDLEEQGVNSLGLTEVLHLDVDLASNSVIVISPVPGSPAAEAGLRTGDVVEAVDGLATRGLAVHEVAALIRRGPAEKAVLRVGTSGKSREVGLDRTRRWMPPPSAEYRRQVVAGRPVGVLSITQFTSDTPGLCRDAAAKFDEWKVEGLVVDVRGNSGGQVDALARVAGLFLGEGTVATVVDRRGRVSKELKSAGPRAMPRLPTAVLTDEGTASAAELLAAFLRENGQVPIVGRPTLGKTLVHGLHRLPDRSALFITLGELRTGAGAVLLRRGLRPDVDANDEDNIDHLILMAAKAMKIA